MNIADTCFWDYLVIGYGNTLRGDDGAGYQVAETVETWNFDRVRSLAVHQLTPDLAEPISHATVVIFVDAAANPLANVQVEVLEPDSGNSIMTHAATPRSLLALSQTLYHACPIAYQFLIPAFDFSFGDVLSPATQTQTSFALAKIKELICGLPNRQSEYSNCQS